MKGDLIQRTKHSLIGCVVVDLRMCKSCGMSVVSGSLYMETLSRNVLAPCNGSDQSGHRLSGVLTSARS